MMSNVTERGIRFPFVRTSGVPNGVVITRTCGRRVEVRGNCDVKRDGDEIRACKNIVESLAINCP